MNIKEEFNKIIISHKDRFIRCGFKIIRCFIIKPEVPLKYFTYETSEPNIGNNLWFCM